MVASKMAKSGKYDAVICLGAVIRGSTSHYDYVCNEVSKGIATVSDVYKRQGMARSRLTALPTVSCASAERFKVSCMTSAAKLSGDSIPPY